MSVIAQGLDQWRSYLLRVTLAFSPARQIFVHRALRLFCFFCFSVTLNFIFCLSIPLWMLVLGPLILGTSHLFASVRYVSKNLTPHHRQQIQITHAMAIVVIVIGALRIFQTEHGNLPRVLSLSDGWEWLALIVTFFAICYFSQLKLKQMIFLPILFIPLALSAWIAPAITAAFLMMGHNFVPFFYWIKSTQAREEKWVALSCLAIFTLIHFVIFIGWTDSLAQLLRLSPPNLGPYLDPLMLARQIFPTSSDFVLLERGISMFAFGQAVHYFLWIKILPEQSLHQETPLTFYQSEKSFKKDLGPYLSQVALVLVLSVFGLMFMFHWGYLRELYIAGVSAHGYVEIAGLPFLLYKRNHFV